VKLDPVLLEILVCPDCKGSLTVYQDHDELVCDQCGLAYPVRDDIPVMLVDQARRPERPTAAGAGSGAEPVAGSVEPDDQATAESVAPDEPTD